MSTERINVEALRGSAAGCWERRGEPTGPAKPLSFGTPITHEQLRADSAQRVKAVEDAAWLRAHEKELYS